ncbi:T9SS type A sorting domain-containing protein [Flavobacterium sp.]|uniref:T9SS type A sorting domain-containing protein n=1 Tax=Flavobacterium sp. TaxID=239 RepID=UPI0039E52789
MATPISLHRHLLAVCTFCIISLTTYSQDILWEKSFGGIHSEYLTDVQPTADYGFILAGSSLSGKTGNKKEKNHGNLDYSLWKMSETGEMEWQKNFGGDGSDFLRSLDLTTDGGFILAGNSNSSKGLIKMDSCRGNQDIWIVKLDAGGGEQWQKTIGGIGQDNVQSIVQTKDGGYILGASSDSYPSGEKIGKGHGGMDCWIIKLDKYGEIQWQKLFGGIYFDEVKSIEQTRDNGYIVGAYSNSPASGNKTEDNNGAGDFWVLKLDSKGDIEWQQVLGGNKDDQPVVTKQTHDGGYILGGNSNSEATNAKEKGNGKGTDFWVVKLDNQGAMMWQETYDFGNSDVLASIVENQDQTILIGGYAASENNGKDKKGIADYIALKISNKGEVLWDKSVGSDGEDAMSKLIETRDGGYLLAGTSNPVFDTDTKSGKGNPSSNSLNGSQNNISTKSIDSQTSKANDAIKETTNNFNQGFNEGMAENVSEINEAVGSKKDSSLHYGLNTPTGNAFGNGLNLGDGNENAAGGLADGLMSGLGGPKTNLPASGDKKTNYGNKDFWVVKLKDKSKPEKKRATIEAMPNPATDYTNVIVGYEFESGTATVVDLAGHILQQFEITSRTVPVNLSRYPQGIYIVNIKTNVQSDGIRIIKTK